MAAQKGAALLLKINTTGTTYVTVGGLRSTSITLNDEMLLTKTVQATARY